MKASVILGSLLLMVGFQASADSVCETRIRNAVLFHHAEASARSVLRYRVLRSEMGAWTEATGNNLGTATVTVAGARAYWDTTPKINSYSVSAEQIGSSNDCKVVSVKAFDRSKLDPIVVLAEMYKLAIGDALYISESDDEWSPFYSRTKVGADFAPKQLLSALGARPGTHIEMWSPADSVQFLEDHKTDNDDIESAEAYGRLLKAFMKDFKEIRVIKLGKPDSGSLDLFILGRLPDGRLVGVRTTTVET